MAEKITAAQVAALASEGSGALAQKIQDLVDRIESLESALDTEEKVVAKAVEVIDGLTDKLAKEQGQQVGNGALYHERKSIADMLTKARGEQSLGQAMLDAANAPQPHVRTLDPDLVLKGLSAAQQTRRKRKVGGS